MVRLRTIVAAAITLVALAVPSVAQARKPLSTATMTPSAFRLTAMMRLDLPVARASACRMCGTGIPDARIGRKMLLGADSAQDRVRLYVKRDFAQWTVDVSTNSAVVGYGFRF